MIAREGRIVEKLPLATPLGLNDASALLMLKKSMVELGYVLTTRAFPGGESK